ETQLAGMGEIKVARGAGVLGCIGLGSCVGVLIYDPATAAAALAHVMLPEPHGSEGTDMPGKYATTALPALLGLLGMPDTIQRKAILIGGAEVFQNRQNTLRIGARNVEKLSEQLQLRRIPIVFEDTGGHQGRSFEFDVATGLLTLRKIGEPTQTYDLSRALGILAKAS
ncbi:MAG: chemotaxis protein CheD, partial [Fimbriimonadales bacterium]